MSSNGTYQGPMPTKISNLNSQYGGMCINKVAPLEELIDDCFKYSIGQLNDANKADVVKQFSKYTVDAHCHENLSFLIEIFKYEYYFDKIINTSKQAKMGTKEHCYLNLSLGRSIEDLPYPTKKADRIYTRKKSTAGMSVRSEDHEPMSVFASTIDDLEDIHQGNEMSNVWDNLMESNVGDSDTESEDDNGGVDSSSVDKNDTESDQELIADQWSLIMNRYVYHNAPEQINLFNISYKKIVEEDKITNIFHSPLVLLLAKNEVLRLLEENVYNLFANSYREKDSRTASPIVQPRGIQESPCSLAIDDSNKSRLFAKSQSANVSPVLTPTSSNVPKLFHKMNKSRLLHLSSSTNNLPIDSGSNSSSSSASSLSNILDHLRLNTNHVNSPLNASPIQTPNQSQPHSLSTSPLYLKEDKISKFGKIWRSKKST